MFSSLKTYFLSKFKPLNFYKKLLESPKTRIFTIIFTVIYLINPFDLMPDFIPILGWIDDFVLLSILIDSVLEQAKAPKSSTVDAKGFRSK